MFYNLYDQKLIELFIKQIMMIGVIVLRNNIKRNQLLN